MSATFLDETGASRPVIMGSYGIGMGRLLACVVEEHHDERGLTWPVPLAPYPVHLVVLPGKEVDTRSIAAAVEEQLVSAGLEPLVDDREESAGVKFNDADLIGLPVRVTVSERAFRQGGLELKLRKTGEMRIIAVENLVDEVRTALKTHAID
jgi:prolyl-tRNA synthetase